MAQSLAGFFRLHRKTLRNVLYAVAFLCAVIGSWMLYKDTALPLWKMLSAVIYEIAQLFLFSPSKGPAEEVSIFYDLARWLAPTSTALVLFSIFEKMFWKLRIWLKQFRGERYLVVGYNPYAKALIEDLLRKDPSRNVTLITQEALPEADARVLQRERVRIETLPFHKTKDPLLEKELRELGIEKAQAMVFFEPEAYNYAALNKLIAFAPRWQRIKPLRLFVGYETAKLRRLIEEQYDQLLAEQAAQRVDFDISYFSLQQLTARQLLEHSAFKLWETPQFQQSWSGFQTRQQISGGIGRVHLLLIGFGDIGRNILLEAVNLGVTNLDRNMKVTIVDPAAPFKMDLFEGEYRYLRTVCDIEIVGEDVRSREFWPALDKIHAEEPITAVCYAIPSTVDSLVNADELHFHLPGVPVAIRSTGDAIVDTYARSARAAERGFVLYGGARQVATDEIILQNAMDGEAKRFNHAYNVTAAQLMGWPAPTATAEEEWHKLNTIKKESSRRQTQHRPVKRAMLTNIAQALGFADVDTLIESWEQRIAGQTVAQQVDTIHADPWMDYMMGLEHKRWSNFYYMRNFQWGEKTDESRRVHDCLIYDWQAFLDSPQKDKAIYDFISSLAIKSE